MKAFIQWTDLFTGRRRFYTQVIFWLIVYCLYILLKEYPASYTGPSLICLVLQETLELLIPSYTQNLLVLPLFRRRRWIAGTAAYLAQVALLISILPALLNFVSIPFDKLFNLQQRADWRREHIAFSVVAFTVVATAIRLAVDRLLLEKERRETELRQLKAQLNPHFLFNTLNNLYGLAVIKSDKLPGLMLKLSDLLRYSVYDTAQDYVPVRKELDYVGDYVELERIRLDENTKIDFTLTGKVEGQIISPLTLMSFIENGFKHFSTPREKPAFVRIVIAVNGNELTLNVSNSLDPLLYLQKADISRSGGVGMENVRQRLKLLYPQKHSIAVTHVPDRYDVELKLQLSR